MTIHGVKSTEVQWQPQNQVIPVKSGLPRVPTSTRYSKLKPTTTAEILTMNLVCGVTRPIRRKDGIFALYLFAVCNFNLYVISIHNPVD